VRKKARAVETDRQTDRQRKGNIELGFWIQTDREKEKERR